MTNNQLAIDFDAATHARRSDPGTSKDSAARVREFAAGDLDSPVDIFTAIRIALHLQQ